MDPRLGADFDQLISLVQANFEQVRVLRREATSQRAILKLSCIYGKYTIRIAEIVSDVGIEYRYYVFDGTYIVAGFDNHADLSAIRLKYGRDWKTHQQKPTPHLHTENKAKLELTREMTCQDFIKWIRANLSPD